MWKETKNTIKVIRCQVCKVEISTTNRTQKYCKVCSDVKTKERNKYAYRKRSK